MSRKQSVLFVSHTASLENPYTDPSLRYRCCNMAHALMLRGHRALVVPQLVLERSPRDFGGFDRYVFHRPRLTETLGDFVAARAPAALSADFDDRTFDVVNARLTPMVRLWNQPVAHVRNEAALSAHAVSFMQTVTVSTTPLGELAQQSFSHARVAVVPNRLDRTFLGLAAALRTENPWASRPYRFGYFSGTPTHDHDFEVATPALRAALERDSDARLLVVGPLELPEALLDLTDQIDRMALMPFHALPYVMAQCQTVVAPLERSEFTESKSAIKFMEVAMLGCRVAATPIADVARFDSPLLTKCTTAEDWLAALGADPGDALAETEGAVAALQPMIAIDEGVEGWLQIFEEGSLA